MNAYELAEEWGKCYDRPVLAQKTGFAMQTMLRQQADRIAELEKVSNKPVAWRFKEKIWWHYNDYGEGEPLYSHPQKELTDNEIVTLYCKYNIYKDGVHTLMPIEFARAVIKASRGEE